MSVKRLIICVFITTIISCSQNDPNVIIPIPKTPAVDVTQVGDSVKEAENLSISAKDKVAAAQAEVERARQEVEAAKKTVRDMRATNSPYADRVEEFRRQLSSTVEAISKWLGEGRVVLDSQIVTLRRAELELAKAKSASLASEKEKETLRSATTQLEVALVQEKKRADSNEKYKEKYHKLTKYKWIVWGLGAWIVIKFLGGLGAWSPQGKIAKALIG
jgi:hypothetical protein